MRRKRKEAGLPPPMTAVQVRAAEIAAEAAKQALVDAGLRGAELARFTTLCVRARAIVSSVPSDAELFIFGKGTLFELAATAIEQKDRVAAARALIEAVRPPKSKEAGEQLEADLTRLTPAELEAEARQATEALEPRQ